MDEFKPSKLITYPEGGFGLLLIDFEAGDLVFEETKRLNNGYAWQAVAEWLVKAKAPNLIGEVLYDSEADMFVARSKNYEALKELARLIRTALEDPKLLREALRFSGED